jgi:hypothetical protein
VREGRTNAWIAHQLEVSPRDIDGFKREHGLAPDDDGGDSSPGPVPMDEDRDMRAEDDALVAAELDAMDEQAAEAGDEEDDGEADDGGAEREGDDDGDGDGESRPRRRGRRGGRRRRGRRPRALEGTFDHGEEGYGLWLDPAVQDDAVYAEHWAGHRPVTVAVEPDRIVIRRRDDGDESDGSGDPEED